MAAAAVVRAAEITVVLVARDNRAALLAVAAKVRRTSLRAVAAAVEAGEEAGAALLMMDRLGRSLRRLEADERMRRKDHLHLDARRDAARSLSGRPVQAEFQRPFEPSEPLPSHPATRQPRRMHPTFVQVSDSSTSSAHETETYAPSP